MIIQISVNSWLATDMKGSAGSNLPTLIGTSCSKEATLWIIRPTGFGDKKAQPAHYLAGEEVSVITEGRRLPAT